MEKPKHPLQCQVAFAVTKETFSQLEKVHRNLFRIEAASAPLAVTARICFITGLEKILRDAARYRSLGKPKSEKKGTQEDG
jgi:hypothetical protein